MSARDIALTAYQQALDAAEAEERAKIEAQRQERLRKEAQERETFEAALPILNRWFPGVTWTYDVEGDWGNDVIVTDADEADPTFKLKVNRYLRDMNDPAAGVTVEIEVGDYQRDSSMPGYSYFSGIKVKSAADVGRYLMRKKK